MTSPPAGGDRDLFGALRAAIGEHPIGPFLLTVTGESHPHLGDVEARWHGCELVVLAPSSWPGSERAGNLAVSLFWPPPVPGGYSLLLDGTARATTDEITITPTRAVHYRPAREGSPPGERCGADCIPLFSR